MTRRGRMFEYKLLFMVCLYNCIGVTVSVPENVPAFAIIYMILARDPDPGQEVEVCVLL